MEYDASMLRLLLVDEVQGTALPRRNGAQEFPSWEIRRVTKWM